MARMGHDCADRYLQLSAVCARNSIQEEVFGYMEDGVIGLERKHLPTLADDGV